MIVFLEGGRIALEGRPPACSAGRWHPRLDAVPRDLSGPGRGDAGGRRLAVGDTGQPRCRSSPSLVSSPDAPPHPAPRPRRLHPRRPGDRPETVHAALRAAVQPGRDRPDLDHGDRHRQPWLLCLRHAVRRRQQARAEAADGRGTRALGRSAAPGASASARAYGSTTTRLCAGRTASPASSAGPCATRSASSWPARLPNTSAIDDRTFEIRLKRPFPLMLDALAKPDSSNPFIMPERIAATDPMKAFTEVIGSGPYRFLPDEFVSGSHVGYAKFDGYVPRPEQPDWATGGQDRLLPARRVEHHPRPGHRVGRACNAARSTGGSGRSTICCPGCTKSPGVQTAGPGPERAHGADAAQPPAAAVQRPAHPPSRADVGGPGRLHARGQRRRPGAVEGLPAPCYPCGTPYESFDAAEAPDARRPRRGAAHAEGGRLQRAEGRHHQPDRLPADRSARPGDRGPAAADRHERRPAGERLGHRGAAPHLAASRSRRAGGAFSTRPARRRATPTRRSRRSCAARARRAGSAGGTARRRRRWCRSGSTQQTRPSATRLARAIGDLALEEVATIPLGMFFVRTAFRSGLTGMLEGPSPYPWNLRPA